MAILYQVTNVAPWPLVVLYVYLYLYKCSILWGKNILGKDQNYIFLKLDKNDLVQLDKLIEISWKYFQYLVYDTCIKFTSDFLYMFEAKVLTYHKTFDKQIKTGNFVIKKKCGMRSPLDPRFYYARGSKFSVIKHYLNKIWLGKRSRWLLNPEKTFSISKLDIFMDHFIDH